MFLNRRVFVALAACLCLSVSTAFAGGGGGTKKDATIEIKNELGGGAIIGVAINPSAKLLTAIANADLDAFKANGGLIVSDGATAKVKVKSGTSRIIVGDAGFNGIADVSKVVNKGKVLKGFVSGSGLNF